MPLAEKKNIEVTSIVEAQLPILFQDPGKIQQILNNLLSNAVKFTATGDIQVVVRQSRVGDQRKLRISVKDSGIGVPADSTARAIDVLQKLYKVYMETDASLVEINPLIVTEDDHVMALDAKMTFDDNAMFRHPALAELRDKSQEDPRETHANDRGLSYVGLAGKIGCTAETLRRWVRRAERDGGQRAGLTTAEQQRIKELEREVRELRMIYPRRATIARLQPGEEGPRLNLAAYETVRTARGVHLPRVGAPRRFNFP